MGLTFIAGAGGLILGGILNSRQAAQLRRFDADLTAAKTGLEVQKGLTLKAQKDLLELQNASLPRTLNVAKAASKLRRYSGTRFEVITIADFEPSHTAALIRQALLDAHWQDGGGSAISGALPKELSRVGIWVEASPSANWVDLPDGSRGPRPAKAVDAVVARLGPIAQKLAVVLREEGLDAKTRPASEVSIPLFPGGGDDAIRIYVSLRPFPGMPDDLMVVSAHN